MQVCMGYCQKKLARDRVSDFIASSNNKTLSIPLRVQRGLGVRLGWLCGIYKFAIRPVTVADRMAIG